MTSPGNAVQMTWEYSSLTRVSETALVEGLNEIGREGWELVSAAQYRDVRGMLTWTAILKRPATGQAAVPLEREAAAAPMAAPPPAASPQAPASAQTVGEDADFEMDAAASPRPKRPLPPRSPRPAPAKPRMELSDDFDFELAETSPAAQLQTRQTKAKPQQAAAEEDFDFELGDTFPQKLQVAKPAAPAAPAAKDADDETDFDLG